MTTTCSLRSDLYRLRLLHIKVETEPKTYMHHAACSVYLGNRPADHMHAYESLLSNRSTVVIHGNPDSVSETPPLPLNKLPSDTFTETPKLPSSVTINPSSVFSMHCKSGAGPVYGRRDNSPLDDDLAEGSRLNIT